MIATGIVLLLFGATFCILGVSLNGDFEIQFRSLMESGKTNTGSVFIVLGAFLAVVGLLFLIIGIIRYNNKKANNDLYHNPMANNQNYGSVMPAKRVLPTSSKPELNQINSSNERTPIISDKIKYCCKCGTRLAIDAKFCNYCGLKMDVKNETSK